MLRLSKKMMFAIEAVLDIAYHAGAEPVQSREITRRQGIPRRYLEQALQHLVRQGILTGVRGPRGGYRLARERRRITVGEVARVVYELEAADDPITGAEGSELAQQVVRPVWHELRQDLMSRLDTITIEDLCRQAHQLGIESDARRRADFII